MRRTGANKQGMSLKQQSREVAITTPLGADVLVLQNLHAREEFSHLFQFDLELLSEDPAVRFEDIIGQDVTVRLRLSGDKARFFHGFISQFTQLAPVNRYPRYRAVMVPWVWFLTRSADCQIFQKKTVPQIIEDVFRKHGFDAYELKLTDTYEPREYCVQYRETAFDFVSRLMEEEGIYYFFKHENGKHTLVLADASSAHQAFEGYAEIAFRPPDDTSKSGEHIRDWIINKEVLTGRYAHTDYNFEMPKTNLEARSEIIREHAEASAEKFDYPGDYQKHNLGDRYARIRIQEIQARQETLHGDSNARGVCVGYTFTLKDHPRPDQKREYLILSTTHTIQSDLYDSAGGAGLGIPVYRCSFSVVPATVKFRPARITPKTMVRGPQTAVVVGPAGEEIYTDKYGRVKVMFHWDRYAKADENSSCWIRVSHEWAGKNWGALYLPRIGQEVIVDFLEGDPDRPIITGRVYNANAMPPYDLPAEKTKSTLKSNSSKGGQGFNEIRFEDKTGKEQIFIHGQHNMDLRVRNNLRETVYGNRDIRVGWEKDGEKGGDLNTLVRQDVNTHVKGSQFELVEKQLNQTVKEDVVQDHQKNQTTVVAEVFTLNAKEIVIEGAQLISEKAGKITIEGSQGVHIRGAMVCVEGSSGVSLKVGGNFLSISPAGVAINGTMVMINSGGAPLAVEAAKAATEASIEDPLEARLADDGKTGQKTAPAAARVLQRTKRSLKPQKAPPYVPPLNTTVPVAPGGLFTVNPPPAAAKTICGGPYNLTDPEKEGDRKASGEFLLEIVPASLLGGDVVFVKATRGCGCAGAVVTIDEHNYALNSPAKVDGWSLGDDAFALITLLGCATPKVMPVQLICGRDKSAVTSGEIRVFPSNKIEIKAELKELVEKCPRVATMIHGLADVLSRVTGKKVDPFEGIKFQAGLGLVIIDAPKLSLAYEAQWREYRAGGAEEWQAYYGWKFSLGLALSAEFKLDVLLAAATCTGVGAPIVSLANRVKEAVGQEEPVIYLGFKGEIAGAGSGGYEEKGFGSLEIKGAGTISLGGLISAKVIQGNLEASTSVSSSVTGKITKTGLEASYELFKWDGVKGKVSVKLHVGKFFDLGYEESVQILDAAGPLIEGALFP